MNRPLLLWDITLSPVDNPITTFRENLLPLLKEFDLSLSVHRCICVEKKNQLDVTEWFIALIICSTCFGQFYAHHQELETICRLLPPIVWSAWLLVVGVRCRAAGYASRKRDVARLSRATSLFLDK